MPNEPEIPAPREVWFIPEFQRNLRQLAKKVSPVQDCPDEGRLQSVWDGNA